MPRQHKPVRTPTIVGCSAVFLSLLWSARSRSRRKRDGALATDVSRHAADPARTERVRANARRTASPTCIPSTSTRFAPALRQSNTAPDLFNPHSAKGSGHAGTLRGFLHRDLYDACPHALVARAHVRGRGQASYKSKHPRTNPPSIARVHSVVGFRGCAPGSSMASIRVPTRNVRFRTVT